MTEFDKKQLSTAMEYVNTLIQQCVDAHKPSEVSAADIQRYTLLCDIAAILGAML